MIGMKQRQGHGGGSCWLAVWPDYVPKQQDICNCGIFVIANALAVAMSERDCGTIDPRQSRIWLTTDKAHRPPLRRPLERDDVTSRTDTTTSCPLRTARSGLRA